MTRVSASSSRSRPGASRALRIGGVVTVAALLVWLGRSGLFERALDAVAALGPAAIPAFVALHVLSVVAFVPSAVPNLAAGLLFGVKQGFFASLAGAGLGAALTFGLGRFLGREWLERRFGGDARFHSLIRLVSERGWRIIVLARLTPIFPFAIANYAFGLTRMSAWRYGAASMLGSIPSTAVLVSLGAAAGGLGSERGARTPGEWALVAAGVVATVALFLVLRRLALEALSGLPEEREGDGEPGGAGAADASERPIVCKMDGDAFVRPEHPDRANST